MSKIYLKSSIIAIIITFLFIFISLNVVHSEDRLYEGIPRIEIEIPQDLPTSKLSMGWPLPMYQKYYGGMPSLDIRNLFFLTSDTTIEIYWTNIISQSSIVFLISFTLSVFAIKNKGKR